MKDNTQRDPIDAMLSVGDDYLDDEGFTQQVVAALPRRRRCSTGALPAIGIAATGLASAWLLPWQSVLSAWAKQGPAAAATPAALCVVVAVAVLITAAASLAGER